MDLRAAGAAGAWLSEQSVSGLESSRSTHGALLAEKQFSYTLLQIQ